MMVAAFAIVASLFLAAGTASASGQTFSVAKVGFSASQTAQLKALFADASKVKVLTTALNTGLTHRSEASVKGASPDVAIGWGGDHVWVTASYYDIYWGAVMTAGGACVAFLATHGLGWVSWICGVAVNALINYGRGWGWAGNHGLWANIYPGWYTVGRW